MNVEMMLKVADYIETHPQTYDQSRWCGTTCCIAGTAVMLAHGFYTPVAFYKYYDFRRELLSPIGASARDILDLDAKTASRLFSSCSVWPARFQFGYVHFEPDEDHHLKAAAYLRALVAEYESNQPEAVALEESDVELVA